MSINTTSTTVNAQYIDILWLKAFGLNANSILDYFYTSPFFDTTSNNQIIRTQGISVDHLISMVGIEFVLDNDNIDEPSLYVIKKQQRTSPLATILLEVFYCLDGTIYQSPIFLDLLRSKFAKSANYLYNAYNIIAKNSVYSTAEGHLCDINISYNDSKKSNENKDDTVDDNNDDGNKSSSSNSNDRQSNAINDRRNIMKSRDFPSLENIIADLSADLHSTNTAS